MKVQSLSIDVPGFGCVNNCKFCVSNARQDDYENILSNYSGNFAKNITEYIKRLNFARDNDCNNLIFTGRVEPQQNREFLTWFGFINQMLEKPFRNIEMQTTGIFLDKKYLRFLKSHVGVNKISLSLSSFRPPDNKNINESKIEVNIKDLCDLIKQQGITLRLSLNLNNIGFGESPDEIMRYCRNSLTDQITFRKLYASDKECEQNNWINENKFSDEKFGELSNIIKQEGTFIEKLEYGLERYDLYGKSFVIDTDCMDKNNNTDVYRYFILRPDCKIYSKWDSKASLIF